jgi:hypothetical protein
MARRVFVIMALLGAACLGAPAAEEWKNVTKEDGLPGDRVQFIEVDPDGTAWIGTLSGVATFRDGKVTVINGPDGKPLRQRVWDVLRVGKGKYWIATSGGAFHLDGGKVTEHLTKSLVAQILPFGKAGLIAKVGGKGVMTYDGEAWKPLAALNGKQVEILTGVSDGTVWITVEADGVYVVDPKKPEAKPVQHLRGTNVKVVMEDSRHRIWCGMWARGVMSFDGKTWTRHLKREKSYILNIHEDAEGGIWVATNAHGLYHYDGEAWQNLLRDEGAMNMVEVTTDGRVWISTQMQGGLRYFDGKTWRVSLSSPLPIRCLAETKTLLLAGGVLDGLHYRKK